MQWGFKLYFAGGRYAMLTNATKDALVGAIGGAVGTGTLTVRFASGASGVVAVAVLGTVVGLMLLGVAAFFVRRALARKEGSETECADDKGAPTRPQGASSDVACVGTKGEPVYPVDAGDLV